jgi:hypothetical protein
MKQQIIVLYLEDIALSWLIGEASDAGDTDEFGVPLSILPYPKETDESGSRVLIIISGVETVL